jgi:serine/threonine-protein kinase
MRLPVLLTAALLAACSGAAKTAPEPPAPPPISPPPSGGDGIFTAPNVWNQRVDGAALHPDSRAMIDRLVAQGGFGNGGRFQVDFSFRVIEAAAGAPRAPLSKSTGYWEPDCDSPATVPLPPGGAIEGGTGYSCDAANADCHLLVVSRSEGRLYELANANRLASGAIASMCAAVWDTTRSYGPRLRGDQCTSADAAGLPIAPLLFSADELFAGTIDHAIRFILPNPRMRAGAFVHPATHAGGPSGPADALPYGSRLRLRADFPLASLPAPARVVAVALQRYGMILADGGDIALTARDDGFTAHKWADLGFDSHSLFGIVAGDFEVVAAEAPIALTYDCVREP